MIGITLCRPGWQFQRESYKTDNCVGDVGRWRAVWKLTFNDC